MHVSYTLVRSDDRAVTVYLPGVNALGLKVMLAPDPLIPAGTLDHVTVLSRGKLPPDSDNVAVVSAFDTFNTLSTMSISTTFTTHVS